MNNNSVETHWDGTRCHGASMKHHTTHLTVCDLWDHPAKTTDYIYFINYRLLLPENVTIDDMVGYGINNNNSSVMN